MDRSSTHSPEPEPKSGSRRTTVDVESPEAKRRKIRKGTRSCWECKRRKIRCNFGSAADTLCIGCQRRGTHCLSQEYPEEASRPAEKNQQIGDRIVRVEALVEQLVRKARNASPQGSHACPAHVVPALSKTMSAETEGAATVAQPGLPTPSASDVESTRVNTYCNTSPAETQSATASIGLMPLVTDGPGVAAFSAPGLALPTKLQRLSRELYAALPTPDVVSHIIESVGGFSLYFHQMMMRPQPDFDLEPAMQEQTVEIPPPDTHPVLLARFLLNLAEYLQYTSYDPSLLERLGESPRSMIKRLAEAAIAVNTEEELMGSLESLECIILEGAYELNSGNLRRAWLAFRRAMALGQLMGIHRKIIPNVKRLDPNNKADPHFVWFRIQLSDRYLCLMLGLPPGSSDNSFASEDVGANTPPMNKLERQMCIIAAHILERNEAAAERCEYAKTREIDLELQRAAKIMPSKWWLPPNLSQLANADHASIFWEALRLINQILYYNLLNHLHLPYMLMFNLDFQRQTVYSKLACVNASREVLSRFVAFRNWNRVAFCCRFVDFFALMASMTLVLAHLHASDEPDLNCLAHQRHGDRAMMEQVLESMETVHKLNMDILSQKSADLLRRLLEIEADAAEGRRYDARSVLDEPMGGAAAKPDRCAQADDDDGADEEPGVLRMCIPYFGVIKIARRGGISRELPATAAATTSTSTVVPTQQMLGITDVSGVEAGDNYSRTPSRGSSMPASGLSSDYCPIEQQAVFNMSKLSAEQHHQRQQQPQKQTVLYDNPHPVLGPSTRYSPATGLIEDPLLQQYPYPGLAASADDWAFQGVDMAFFDSLMKGMGQDATGAGGRAGVVNVQPAQAEGGGLGFGGSWQ